MQITFIYCMKECKAFDFDTECSDYDYQEGMPNFKHLYLK